MNIGEMKILSEAASYGKSGMMPKSLGMKANAILQREGMQLYDPSRFVSDSPNGQIGSGEEVSDKEAEDASRTIMGPENLALDGNSPVDSADLARELYKRDAEDPNDLTDVEMEFLDNYIKSKYGSRQGYREHGLEDKPYYYGE